MDEGTIQVTCMYMVDACDSLYFIGWLAILLQPPAVPSVIGHVFGRSQIANFFRPNVSLCHFIAVNDLNSFPNGCTQKDTSYVLSCCCEQYSFKTTIIQGVSSLLPFSNYSPLAPVLVHCDVGKKYFHASAPLI